MKERIYTIPVTDALCEDSECFICLLEKKLEQNYTAYELGPAMMEEDNRTHSDEKGFCKRHFEIMFASGNRLSMALVLSTHLKCVAAEFDKCFEKSIFGKKDITGAIINYVTKLDQNCLVCEKIKDTMLEYIETILYIWSNEREFREKFRNCKGICVSHMKNILEGSKEHLSLKKQQELLNDLQEIQNKNLKRIQEDIDWFVRKFDYRYQDQPWGNSQDAVVRTIEKISGYIC